MIKAVVFLIGVVVGLVVFMRGVMIVADLIMQMFFIDSK